jgi:hypothetical protein
VGGKHLGAHREAKYHSMDELRFQLLDRENKTLLQAGMVRSAGPLCTLGKQVSWFSSQNNSLVLSPQWGIWHSSFLAGSGRSPTARHSEECWASVHLGGQASWLIQGSGLPLGGEAAISALGQVRLDSV